MSNYSCGKCGCGIDSSCILYCVGCGNEINNDNPFVVHERKKLKSKKSIAITNQEQLDAMQGMMFEVEIKMTSVMGAPNEIEAREFVSQQIKLLNGLIPLWPHPTFTIKRLK